MLYIRLIPWDVALFHLRNILASMFALVCTVYLKIKILEVILPQQK